MTQAQFSCTRCGNAGPRLSTAPTPGTTGAEILEKICADCWQAWTEAEVMVINELRLNFMEPASLKTLERHMREFLLLDSPPAAD